MPNNSTHSWVAIFYRGASHMVKYRDKVGYYLVGFRGQQSVIKNAYVDNIDSECFK